MQHLATVNRFLRVLGAAPVLTPHEFPFAADVYPFVIDLRPLTRPRWRRSCGSRPKR